MLLPLWSTFDSVASQKPTPTLQTRWAAAVTARNAHREYPRPQMVRKAWVNLNGLWDLSIQRGTGGASSYKILVPFPPESQLSGVMQPVRPDDLLIYRRSFSRPKGKRILLHFGAADWETAVFVNGRQVGSHKGGYDPFSIDITDALTSQGKQQLEVRLKDPTDKGPQPRGKQALEPGGIFYTPTSGIWQTVWLEPVPERSIESLRIDPSNDGDVRVSITPRVTEGAGKAEGSFKVSITDQGKVIEGTGAVGSAAVLRVMEPRLWSPSSPVLYSMKVQWGEDSVDSYFAFREVSLSKEPQPRILLNGKPLFLIGPLDQGFWPDGLYTAPSDEAMKYDIEVTKRLGFNMIRKHVKVEPDRWYYWADKMGIYVLQDMPSGDNSIGPADPDITRSPESAKSFRRELKAMIDARRNHPSIVSWVLYNEGWGQWNTVNMTRWLKAYDPTRLVDSTTGWTDRDTGDMRDVHVYPGPGAPPASRDRALLLGEFGGLGLPVPGHMWRESGWGYQSFKTSEELTEAFVGLLRELRFLIGKPGLSGAVYTQTTDVETELNGLMTYDRALLKMDESKVRRAIADLFLPPPTLEVIAPTSEETGINWRYSLIAPPPQWTGREFDDRTWSEGPGGFGTPETPGAIVRTRWDTQDIWLRREFVVKDDVERGDAWLSVSYDDDIEVYLDGEQMYKAPGWTTSYKLVPLQKRLTKGAHTLAIHCRQNRGGQYVDAGIVRIRERQATVKKPPKRS